ncbi:MAG: hypothetical protein ACQERG_06205, partial [Pseudomonadota bacterium]
MAELDADRRLATIRADAEAGVPRARRLLALRMLEGRGVEPDPETAVAWLQADGEAGYGPALR